MERSIKVPGGCRLNHPLTRTYIIVPYSGSLQRLIVSKAQKPHSYVTAGIWQIFRGKEAANASVPTGLQGVASQDIRYPREEVEAAGWPLSQEPGRSSCKFYRHGGRTRWQVNYALAGGNP